MNRKMVGAFLVFAVAVGIVVWRETRRPQGPAAPAAARIVLFADLSEVDEIEGCGAIIRAVRRAAEHGLTTAEIDSRYPSDLTKRYRLLVAPSVVFFDEASREVRRFQGESPETVRAIRAEVATLVGTQ